MRAPSTWQKLPLKRLQLNTNAAVALIKNFFDLVSFIIDRRVVLLIQWLRQWLDSYCVFEKQVLDSSGLLRVNRMRRQEHILRTDVSAL